MKFVDNFGGHLFHPKESDGRLGDDVHVGVGRPDGGCALERAALPFKDGGRDVDP